MNKTRAVKNVKSSKFTICNSQQTEKVWQVEFNTISWVFGLNTAESEMFKEMRPNYSSIRKQTAYGMCFMNEQQSNSQEHEDCSKWQYKKPGCCDWGGLPLKAMERILEQALRCSLEGQWWLDDCGWLEITMKDFSMISVAHSCFFLFHFWTVYILHRC